MHPNQIELWGIKLTSDHIKSKQYSLPLSVRLVQYKNEEIIYGENISFLDLCFLRKTDSV